jgi:hypothetical protein
MAESGATATHQNRAAEQTAGKTAGGLADGLAEELAEEPEEPKSQKGEKSQLNRQTIIQSVTAD